MGTKVHDEDQSADEQEQSDCEQNNSNHGEQKGSTARGSAWHGSITSPPFHTRTIDVAEAQENPTTGSR